MLAFAVTSSTTETCVLNASSQTFTYDTVKHGAFFLVVTIVQFCSEVVGIAVLLLLGSAPRKLIGMKIVRATASASSRLPLWRLL